MLLGALVLLVLQLASCVDQGPLPTKENCPECAFGKWSCPLYACTRGAALPVLTTNFTYQADKCWKEIPLDGRTLQLDVDITCHEPDVLSCDTMSNYVFAGVEMFSYCQAKSETALQLATETCGWACKDDRVVARCTWSFDPRGDFFGNGSHLESCWLHKVCTSVGLEVHGACRPNAIWLQAGSTAAELAKTRHAVTQAEVKYAEALSLLRQLIKSDGSTNQLTAAQLTKNNTEEELISLIMALGAIQETANDDSIMGDTGGDVAREVLKQQVGQQLAHVITDLSQLLAQLEDSTRAHAATSAELDRARAAYGLVSGSLRESEEDANTAKQGNTVLAQENVRLEEKNTSLKTVLIICLAALVVVVIACGAFLYMYRRNMLTAVKEARTTHQFPVGPAMAGANGDLMVVGRPVPADGSVAAGPVGGGPTPTKGKEGLLPDDFDGFASASSSAERPPATKQAW